jgi:hypothetical protein
MIDLAVQAIECDLGLDEEIEGWLALQYPAMAAELDASRKKADEHAHRKLCSKILHAYRKQFPATLEWRGSDLGRPVYIVAQNPRGPDEVSIEELTKALAGPDPKTVILQAMSVKKMMGGGVLQSTALTQESDAL